MANSCRHKPPAFHARILVTILEVGRGDVSDDDSDDENLNHK